jgi:hypothetical protein
MKPAEPSVFLKSLSTTRLLAMTDPTFCRAESPIRAIQSPNYIMEERSFSLPLHPEIRSLVSTVDLVVVDVSESSHAFLNSLRSLVSIIGVSTYCPTVVCFSTRHRSAEFILAIQKCGARYVRVSDPATLLEAIELLLAQMQELKRNGPLFQIIHRFSRGLCAPGEEIAAIMLMHDGSSYQLPLGLTQRFVFDFLAQHRRIALDSSQIASGLSGDQFYRMHAANSGQRQYKQIRRPTVKVLTQRIRKAVSRALAEVQLPFDAVDILRSCPAEGSRVVLYRLQAQIRWHHVW